LLLLRDRAVMIYIIYISSICLLWPKCPKLGVWISETAGPISMKFGMLVDPIGGMLKFKISDRSVRWGLIYDRAKYGILAERDGWALLGETTVSPDIMSFKLCTLNVRGMRDRVKRRIVFNFLRDEKIDIAFLQETHSVSSDFRYWRSEWGSKILVSHG